MAERSRKKEEERGEEEKRRGKKRQVLNTYFLLLLLKTSSVQLLKSFKDHLTITITIPIQPRSVDSTFCQLNHLWFLMLCHLGC